MDQHINSSNLFSYIFNRANIFSFTDILPQIFTSQGSWVIFVLKSLKTPLMWKVQCVVSARTLYNMDSVLLFYYVQVALTGSNKYIHHNIWRNKKRCVGCVSGYYVTLDLTSYRMKGIWCDFFILTLTQILHH